MEIHADISESGPGNSRSEDAAREDPVVIIRWRHQKAIALSSAAAASIVEGATIEDATASERARAAAAALLWAVITVF